MQPPYNTMSPQEQIKAHKLLYTWEEIKAFDYAIGIWKDMADQCDRLGYTLERVHRLWSDAQRRLWDCCALACRLVLLLGCPQAGHDGPSRAMRPPSRRGFAPIAMRG